jgi:ATP-binding cassette subfamily B protein
MPVEQQFCAPVLITRKTHDVQQGQIMVLLSSTMFIAAPITMIGGIFMALRTDIGLSWLVVVAVPLLGRSVRLVVMRWRRRLRLMETDRRRQPGLPEQITGIRVVRAFVREPYETARFAKASGDVTETQTSVGRYVASIFPIVMFILNASSVAVLWFGAMRIDSGKMQIGALTAFLTYLIQILMSVMMATFLLIIAPRAIVCAERIQEVLTTESSVVLPEHPVTELAKRSVISFTDAEFSYLGADFPSCGCHLHRRAG